MPAGNVRPRASQVGTVLDPDHPYHRAPRGMWLVARRPTNLNYPCRCAPGCGKQCPCRGRTDGLDAMPGTCCARRARDTATRATEPASAEP